MRRITDIAIHCTAGFSEIPEIEKFWRRPKSQGGAGWNRSKGYHIIIDLEGKSWFLINPLVETGGYSREPSAETLEFITNGVFGQNKSIVNISYIGGVDPDNYSVAKDTRTPKQKKGIEKAIIWALCQIENFQPISDIKIKGHRDFSPDKNGNGVVDSWERIKECPSYDAIPEYQWIIGE